MQHRTLVFLSCAVFLCFSTTSAQLTLNTFSQETSNGDFSSLTLGTTSATVVSSNNVSFSLSSSGYCAVTGTQSNIQFVSLDVTPIVEKFKASNWTSGNVTIQCSRPAFPECYFYKWQPQAGFVTASRNTATNMSWPSPYTAACVSYSSGQACASQTFATARNLVEGNLTSHLPCAPVVLPFTDSDIAANGGALIVGVTVPYTTAVCGAGGGYLLLNCVGFVSAGSD